MNPTITTHELSELIVKRSGMKKKDALAILRAIPEIIEEGVLRDGEVRVKGLGTFRMKWIQERVGRNPKTGETVRIPPHNRLVLLPEQSLKDYLNRDLQLLTYEVIDEEESTMPEPAAVTIEDKKPKRHIHWIVPVAIVIIAILSVVFYFRNFYDAGERRQESEDKSQEIIADSAELAIDSGQLAVGGQQSETQEHSNLETQAPVTQNTEPETRNPYPVKVSEGKRYFQLAREAYGNPFLWVLIFDANKEKSPNPDILVSGTDVIIPRIEGKPYNLTRNDSLAVSKGYTAVYEYYQGRNDPRAEEFFHVAEKYKPK